ncbi:MAG: hypothetical protein IJT89_08550 [Bacteroidaceae bacterium]|nr:hypothetical protein [Bacteroidaceae bacterium]MBQ7484084.1 hypothetical protein [Bacteroidaceae bacterium]
MLYKEHIAPHSAGGNLRKITIITAPEISPTDATIATKVITEITLLTNNAITANIIKNSTTA